MRPYCTPLSREVIENIALESVDTLEFHPEIVANADFVKEQIVRSFSDPGSPMVFENKGHFARYMFYQVDAPTLAIAERCGLDPTEVISYRKKVCIQIALVFYKSYIQEALKSFLIPYCQTHAPKRTNWGVCSISRWDNQWGLAFYDFWKSIIEKNDDDIFCEQILPYLPEKWRLSYKPNSVCPHIWHEMTDDEMVSVLTSLEKPIDPAKQTWGLGSLALWKDPKTKNAYGKSFWSYWRRKIEAGDESIFLQRILPKFPVAWQRNFEHKNLFHWHKMTPREIADIIETSRKPLGVKKWGLGSMNKWTFKDRVNSKNVFLNHWRKLVEGPGEDAIFRRDILPLLSETLQKTYRPNGYTMSLREDNEEDQKTIQLVDDPDSLYELADKGNRGAFEKLKRILILHVTTTLIRLDLEMDILDHVIERAIHAHLPFFGSIKTYATVCVEKFFQNFQGSIPLVLTEDHHVHYHKASAVIPENKVEISTISSIDAKKTIGYFQKELAKRGFSSDLILRLFELLIDGISLDEVISPDATGEYEIDPALSPIAAALRSIISEDFL